MDHLHVATQDYDTISPYCTVHTDWNISYPCTDPAKYLCCGYISPILDYPFGQTEVVSANTLVAASCLSTG